MSKTYSLSLPNHDHDSVYIFSWQGALRDALPISQAHISRLFITEIKNTSIILSLVTTLEYVMDDGCAVLCPPAISLALRVNLPSLLYQKLCVFQNIKNPVLPLPISYTIV